VIDRHCLFQHLPPVIINLVERYPEAGLVGIQGQGIAVNFGDDGDSGWMGKLHLDLQTSLGVSRKTGTGRANRRW